MSKKDDEFIDAVTDGSYNLSCLEVILKLVNQTQTLVLFWVDERIKKIVAVLATEGIKISKMTQLMHVMPP